MADSKSKIDYSKTVNLPRTDFPQKANLPQREPEIFKFWEKIDIYNKIQHKNRNGEWYLLHDGPPYANGRIHMGTSLNKVLKDLVVKYRSMRGYKTPFVPGWDCHGHPVEYQLFKELKKTKHDVEQVEFRKKAKDFALKWVNIQRDEFKRLGIFGAWNDPYLTMNPVYEAKEIEGFGKLYADGYIYKGLKPIYWCCVCETALAEAEVEYKNKTSPSIYVKFKVDDALNKAFGVQDASIVIWTTTPWTLPANLAIALKEDFVYAAVRADGETLILAEGTLERLRYELHWEKYEILSKLDGKKLENLTCQHPFVSRKSKIILGEYVTLDVGTGCVHTAPGHGQEDYVMGGKYGLEIYSPVDETGNFKKDVEHFAGMNVFEANDKIIEHLEKTKKLLNKDTVEHSYPHCWRCKNPVIFRATKQWFLNVDHNNLRQKILNEIKKVKWFPPFSVNRISTMVSNRPDWCLSRQRLWGVPIPIFYCKKCDAEILTKEIIDHLITLVKKYSTDVWFEKETTDLLPKGTKCPKCGNNQFRKETDILDVWFDSSTSHQCVLTTRPDQKFPAELYLEGSDQHRGWFQLSILTSMSLTGKAPFKTVVTHGWTLDEQREKESKSKGNIVSPQEIISKYGADVLRLWVSSVDYASDVIVSTKIFDQMSDTYRKIRNTLRFLLGNLYDFNPETNKVGFDKLSEIDRWILSRTQNLLETVTDAYDNFEFHKVYREIYNFCTIDLSSFYLDILKDRLYTFDADSKARRSSQTAFAEIIRVLTLIVAPIIPFTAEECWKYLQKADDADSVHMQKWPEGNPQWKNNVLEDRWQKLIQIRSEVLKALEEWRAAKEIGNSLEAEVVISTSISGDDTFDFLNSFDEDLKSVFIVSGVEVIKKEGIEPGKIQPEVKKTKSKKCQRCWKYSITVGKSSTYPEICANCVKVVEKLSV